MNEYLSRWLSRDPDSVTREELQELIDSGKESELSQRFSGRLEFGTAGLRGLVGAGPCRMNRLVIQETATGLGGYLLAQQSDAATKGVIVGYDGRPDSRQFARDTAGVLTALGIKVYLMDKAAPTPLVAFGINYLKTAAGVVVTASHNPPQYNGFKVYWSNGAQIIPPHDEGIARAIDKASREDLRLMDLDQASQQGLLVWLGRDYCENYRKMIGQSPLLQNHTDPDGISLAYTAMHGVGAEMAETLLNDAGFNQVFSVAAQREPDGTFPTVNFPNPEEPGAMDMVMAEASAHNTMLACANDPDADRFAVAVRQSNDSYQMLTGDQVGALFGDYLLRLTGAENKLVGCTIVSSSLLGKIAHAMGAEYYQTLTGFKWLTNVAMSMETKERQFLFAYEEALGYTIGSQVWDKDGLSALVVFARLCAELNATGKTVWDQLETIYRKHGLHLNAQRSIALDPASPSIGDTLRAAQPEMIAGQKVMMIEDLKSSRRTFADGREEVIQLPVSDVLIYHLESGNRVVARPSGTEPKLKCYYEVVEPFDRDDSMEQVQRRADVQMHHLIEAHQASLGYTAFSA